MDGTVFDIRGLIQLASSRYKRDNFPGQVTGSRYVMDRFPGQVTGVPVARKCRRLHFLHASIWGFGPAGTVIGRYVFHYRDGAVWEQPLVFGRDVFHWWAEASTNRTNSRVVWSGQNAKSRVRGEAIQLSKFIWENPRPDAEIVSLDLVSSKEGAALFLVAITID